MELKCEVWHKPECSVLQYPRVTGLDSQICDCGAEEIIALINYQSLTVKKFEQQLTEAQEVTRVYEEEIGHLLALTIGHAIPPFEGCPTLLEQVEEMKEYIVKKTDERLENEERAEKAELELHETNVTAKNQASVIRNLRQENKRLLRLLSITIENIEERKQGCPSDEIPDISEAEQAIKESNDE